MIDPCATAMIGKKRNIVIIESKDDSIVEPGYTRSKVHKSDQIIIKRDT